MLKTAVIASLVLLMGAQSQSQRMFFSLQMEQGIQYAKKNDVPIMFYVRGSSGGDDDVEDYERDHVRVFANPEIFKLSKNYVCLQMSRSRYRQQILDWGLSPRTNLNIIFATPDGEMLDEALAASAVGSVKTLASKMRQNLKNFANHLYTKRVEPVFQDPEADIRKQRDALKLVARWNMQQAAPATMKILNREKLDRTTRTAALKALAGIGSSQSIDALMKLAIEKDREADKALSSASVGAVEHLLPHLAGNDLAKHTVAYRAITKICKVRSPKSDRFWQGGNQAVKLKEVERVRKIADQKLQDWKANRP